MNLTEFLNSDLTKIEYFFHPVFATYGEKLIEGMMYKGVPCYDISKLLGEEKLNIEIWTSVSPTNEIHGTNKHFDVLYPHIKDCYFRDLDYEPFAVSGGIFAVATKDIKSHDWIMNAIKERIKDWPNYINYCIVLSERQVNDGKVLDLIIRGFDTNPSFKDIIDDLKTHPKNKQHFRTL